MFCVREFIKTESATAEQRAFRLRFNIQPPTRKSICRWNHQFEQIGCLCKGKSYGRPRVTEENVKRIQENFGSSPRKSTRRASVELGIQQPTVWRVLRRRWLFNWVYLFKSPCIFIKETFIRPYLLKYCNFEHFLSFKTTLSKMKQSFVRFIAYQNITILPCILVTNIPDCLKSTGLCD